MKFRTTLFLAMVLLVAGVLAATAGGMTLVLRRAETSHLGQKLASARHILAQIERDHQATLRAESLVIAAEPRIRAVAATEEVSRETVVGVFEELPKDMKSPLFLLTDGGGRLVYDGAHPEASGADLGGVALVHVALASDPEVAALMIWDGRTYQAEALRLSFGDHPFGVLVRGYPVDDALARQLDTLADCAVVLAQGSKILGKSPSLGALDDRAAAAILAAGSETPAEIDLGDERYLALGSTSDAGVHHVLLRSLDAAMAPARAAANVVYLAAAGALLAAALLTSFLSRRLSRPLDGLVALVGGVAAGKLDRRAPLGGPLEVRSLGRAMNRMVEEIQESRVKLAAKERLERELEIGAKIQTCILPREFAVAGLEISAAMIPASEVGGDYYDVFPVAGGGWIGVGDVAGHGLTAGLIMLMVQSTVAALGREQPNGAPRSILAGLNRVLYDNIRNRLHNDEHVTLTLLRYHRDGRLVFAGAHEEIVVLRRSTGRAELVATPGPWLGARRDVSASLVDSTVQLEDGDVMVLYTDGITEAMNETRAQFGIDRLAAIVEREKDKPPSEIRDAILEAVAGWTAVQNDDITLMVLRYSA